jgi:hypothetical protein
MGEDRFRNMFLFSARMETGESTSVASSVDGGAESVTSGMSGPEEDDGSLVAAMSSGVLGRSGVATLDPLGEPIN